MHVNGRECSLVAFIYVHACPPSNQIGVLLGGASKKTFAPCWHLFTSIHVHSRLVLSAKINQRNTRFDPYCTMNTGTFTLCLTESSVVPNRMSFRPRWPWAPITSRSQPASATSFAIASGAWPCPILPSAV